MAERFNRPPEGFRFTFNGMNLNSPPDSLPDGKYPSAVNVRGYGDNSTRTRPGQAPRFTAGPQPIRDIHAYTPIQTSNVLPAPPRILAVDANGGVWLDNSVQKGSLAGGTVSGFSMIPFRPNQSPSPYMYISSVFDYQKFPSPDALNNITQRKVGIAEPPYTPSAFPQPQALTMLLAPGGQWSTGGAASAWVPGVRSNDSIAAALADPLAPGRFSLRVSPSIPYQRGEIVNIGFASGQLLIIEEVLPPLSISMTILSIYYFAGTTGRCIIAPQGVNVSASQKVLESAPSAGINLAKQSVLANLQRGSLIQIGTETCYVWSVTQGPNQQIAIETSTVATHAVGEIITGVPTVIVNGVTTGTTPGTQIQGDPIGTEAFTMGAGVGMLTMGATGGTGTVIARPTTLLNGWGPNAHVGAYEHGVNQGFGFFGTDPSTTSGYSNPNLAYDGNIVTAATVALTGTHTYAGCVWVFPATTPGATGLSLNINSVVRVVGGAARSAGVWYSLDAGVTWIQVYNMVARAQQWDPIPLPSGQDTSKVQVMAFADAHDDITHQVFEINITTSPVNPSIGANTGVFCEDDYLHFSVLLSNPLSLLELQLQLDVGDGTFTQNYYYYSVSPSQLIPASAGTSSQIAAVQAILQQAQIKEETQGSGLTTALPTVAGANQWTEIWIPISGLTRVGGDQTKTLANIVGVQFLVNASGATTVQVSSLAFVGGGTPNIAEAGAPFRYRIRPRDSRTGTTGNPSPATRYGTNARRQPVLVSAPTSPFASYDLQIDTWDVFRYGGAVTSWRYIGSITGFATTLVDNFDDSAAEAGNALEFDNFEPWPSVGLPIITVASVTGTIAFNVGLDPTIATLLLPGNLVQIGGQNVYTLRARPINTTGSLYQLEFEENAGSGTGLALSIYEPAIARQFLPYMWGPDVDGTVFACGDKLRPGTVSFAKSNNPDSAPDRYNVEIVQPSEPLLGGEVLDGLSFVGSPERWWALFPNPGNPAQRYNFVQQPWPRGLAAPFGHCTDGRAIYWWAKDGIYSSRKGASPLATSGSLTDDDLYVLFPHDGLPGQAITYGGKVYQPPDYSRAATFRLAYAQGFLYATYQDAFGTYHTLVCELSRLAWSLDDYNPQVTVFYHPETVGGTLAPATSVTPALYNHLLMGTVPSATSGGTSPVSNLFGSNGIYRGSGGTSLNLFHQAIAVGDYAIAVVQSDAGGITQPAISDTGGNVWFPIQLRIGFGVWYCIANAAMVAGVTIHLTNVTFTATKEAASFGVQPNVLGLQQFLRSAHFGTSNTADASIAALTPNPINFNATPASWSTAVLAFGGTISSMLLVFIGSPAGTIVDPGTNTANWNVQFGSGLAGNYFQVQVYIGQNSPFASAPTLVSQIAVQQDLSNDLGGPITSILATREFDGGDVRAGEQWGDLYMDTTPAAPDGIQGQLYSLGLLVGGLSSPAVPTAPVRTQGPVPMFADILADFLGVQLTWTDDYTRQAGPTYLYVWQPSFLPKPEVIGLRVTDWDDAGIKGAKWMQGFILHADTFGIGKGLAVQEADAPLTFRPYTPVVLHTGETEKAYSFTQPFIAHLVRLFPTDQTPWRFFDVRWIAEPTPEFAQTWATQPSTHGLQGFLHVRQIALTYASSGVGLMTLQVTAYDGVSPAPITLPNTAGAIVKTVFPFTANKGQLYAYRIISNQGAAARIFVSQSEVLVGQWGREDSYVNRPLVGGVGGDKAEV